MASISRRALLASSAFANQGRGSGGPAAGLPRDPDAHRITDIRVMVLDGPRSYTLVKTIADGGLFGIGEGFGSPGVGVKEGILELRPYFTGKNPLDIEALAAGVAERADGAAPALWRSLSAIEISLWDLAGKILGRPVCRLLGGKYRERIRLYHDESPRNMLDRASCREWAERMKAHPAGWTAFRLELPRSSPSVDKAKDASNRVLTQRELREIRQSLEACRDAIGQDYDLILACHGEFGLPTARALADAIQGIKPLFLEDPLPAGDLAGWARLRAESPVPIAAGEPLGRRQGFADLLSSHACAVTQLDVRNVGGLLEAKKIADFADVYGVPIAGRNSGGAVAAYATAHWAASARNFLAADTVIGRGNWMDDVVVHQSPLVKDGCLDVPERPGLGIELNPEVVKANLARGEKYWG